MNKGKVIMTDLKDTKSFKLKGNFKQLRNLVSTLTQQRKKDLGIEDVKMNSDVAKKHAQISITCLAEKIQEVSDYIFITKGLQIISDP